MVAECRAPFKCVATLQLAVQPWATAEALELAKSAVILSKIEVELSNTEQHRSQKQKHFAKVLPESFCFCIVQCILDNSGLLKISPWECFCNVSIGVETHFAAQPGKSWWKKLLYCTSQEWNFNTCISHCNSMIRIGAAWSAFV